MSSEDVFHLGIKALIRNQTGEVLLMQVNPVKLNYGHFCRDDLGTDAFPELLKELA